MLDLALSSAAADGPAWTHLPWPAMALIGQRLAAAPQAIGMGRGVCSTWNVTLAEAVNLLAPSKFSCRSTEKVAPGAQAAQRSATAYLCLHCLLCSAARIWPGSHSAPIRCIATVALLAGAPTTLLILCKLPGAVSECCPPTHWLGLHLGVAAAAQTICCLLTAWPAGPLDMLLHMPVQG